MADDAKLLDYLKRATADLRRTRGRLRELEEARREPIAVVAMACRYPGGADTPEDLWSLVRGGADAVTPFPGDRGWRDVRGYADSGGFLGGADAFDAAFFGISPREAAAMDPQQRLLLEAAWEAVERAGTDPTALRGTRTGVFAGVSHLDYRECAAGAEDEAEGYLLTGSVGSVVAGRVAYALGLEGPAMTVDTACSSSLAAVHLAVRALRSGECDGALAGGVTVMNGPSLFEEFSRQGALSPDGRCRAFAASADGTGFAEGVGLLMLERLSDAVRGGRRVLAVVRGSAVNSDGASNGLTAPSGPAQERVIADALADAGLGPGEVDVVEAHGTGTRLGDPIEAHALMAAYGKGREPGRALRIGSVKSNIGHTQAAAGVAGIIKTVMALRHEELPGSLHIDAPTPHADWDGTVRPVAENEPWARDPGRRRRAGVSSFGVSGTNAHVILEEAPDPDETGEGGGAEAGPARAGRTAAAPGGRAPGAEERSGEPAREPAGAGAVDTATGPGGAPGGVRGDGGRPVAPAGAGGVHGRSSGDADPGRSGPAPGRTPGRPSSGGPTDPLPFAPRPGRPLPWVLSARTSDALAAQARRLASHLAGPGAAEDPAALGRALAQSRTAFEYRAAVVAGDTDAARTGLQALAEGRTGPGAVPEGGRIVPGGRAGAPGRTVFVFPGQGQQWEGMARDLLRESPAFARRMGECVEALRPHVDFEPLAVLRGDPGAPALDRDDVVQPVLWCMMVSLAALWESCGVRPDLIIGHSQGEIAAACAAGALSLEDAARIIAVRGRALLALAGRGAATSVGLPVGRIEEWIADNGAELAPAAINGPESVVVSGAQRDLERLEAWCSAQGVHSRRLAVFFAAHGPAVDEVRADFLAGIAGVAPRTARVPLVSSVTAGPVDGAELDAEYWFRNLRLPVLFAPAVGRAAEEGAGLFVEVSAHPVARVGLAQTLGEAGAAVGTLARGEGGPDRFQASLAEAHRHGARPDWDRLFPEACGPHPDLPTYPFQRRSYRLRPARPRGDLAAAGLEDGGHAMLGAAVDGPGSGRMVLTGRLGLADQPWLAEHGTGGRPLLAGTGLLDLALHTAAAAGAPTVESLELLAPLWIPATGDVRLHAEAEPGPEPGAWRLRIHSRERDGDWRLHAEGVAVEEEATGGAEASGAGGASVTGEAGGRGPGAVADDRRQPGASRPPAPGDGGGQARAGAPAEIPPPRSGPADPASAVSGTVQDGPSEEAAPVSPGDSASARGEAEGGAGAGVPGGRTVASAPAGAAGAERDAHAQTARAASSRGPHPPFPEQWPPPEADEIPLDSSYARMAGIGYRYGPAFRGLRRAWVRGEGVGADVYGDVRLPDSLEVDGYGLHPALLDACLHAMIAVLPEVRGPGRPGARVRMAFSWEGVRLHAVGARALRVRITETAPGVHRVTAVDPAGAPVLTADALTMREAAGTSAAEAAGAAAYRLDWRPLSETEGAPAPGAEHAAGPTGPPDLAVPAVLGGLPAPVGATAHPDLAALAAHIDSGAPAPSVVAAPVPAPDPGIPRPRGGARPDPGAEARGAVRRTLRLMQAWLADERFASSRLALVTCGAVATRPGEHVPDLAGAAVWGLLRAAQTEHPGRFLVVDTDPAAPGVPDPAPALASGEPQAAVRDGRVLVPRLAPPHQRPPADPADRTWRLVPDGSGRVDGLERRPHPGADGPLAPDQVRIDVRAAGLNFRDLLLTLGYFPGGEPIGFEAAGVVTAVGADVGDLAPGDRVMGLVVGAVGPVGTAHRRTLARVPDGWTLAQAATSPGVFLTAYHALVGTAAVRPGERVLVHAATGGVGMAAVQIARHLGAEVYATAAAHKRHLLRAAGLPEERIADTRTPGFADRFLHATGGQGVDTVLNCLTGEMLEASLRLLPRGGRFVELGRTDLRDPAEVAEWHPGVRYHSLELPKVSPERIGDMLTDLLSLFERGYLRPLPAACLPVGEIGAGMRRLQMGLNTGKLGLTVPRPLDPAGTVLITGGTGALGGLVAEHLVRGHGVRHLLLLSRSGPDADGARRLVDRLRSLGADAAVRACDVADRADLERALAEVPPDRPITGVFHAAAVVEDATVEAETPGRSGRVLAAKAEAAWALHELTLGDDLAAFVLFSSAAGVLGSAGQGSYAAANAFLDGLAAHRAALGLPALSLAWGLWDVESGPAGRLGRADQARMARAGLVPMPADAGTGLLDTGLAGERTHAVPMLFDPSGPREHARRTGAVAPLLGDLAAPARPRRRALRAAASERARTRPDTAALAALPEGERRAALLETVRGHAAEVLGHADPAAVPADAEFLESGFDSLTAVELRNRLATDLGRRLPAGLAFAHPTPERLAAHLAEVLAADTAAPPAPAPPAAGEGNPSREGHGLVDLMLRACRTGRAAEGIRMLEAAAALRPVFESALDAGDVPPPKRLAAAGSDSAPVLVCVPSLLMNSGPHEYARFAAAVEGRAEAVCLTHPGFSAGERLPAAVDALVELHARNLRERVDGRRFALVGRSSGAWAAHALAAQLESTGVRPAALVLVDPPMPDDERLYEVAARVLLEGEEEMRLADDARATASGGHLALFRGWVPEPVAAPALVLRPEDGAPGDEGRSHRFTWEPPHEEAVTGGDHLTMLEGRAQDTAAAVLRWLETVEDDGAQSPRQCEAVR
ncbi:type I polyketide synthase [Nocardiopsis chromatogenes]|uniref:type I polyketide synthase n=1 Tax=Nocardiopsis chromatogenes TaxID=280239 RepID=UPI000345638C|nr:type I polyketide synthase [Nocardiopsis chromatogenes]